MRIKSQASTMIVLTRFDQIPILELLNNKKVDQLFTKRYSFQEITLGPSADSNGLINYKSGNFTSGNSSFVIHRISIEERKIVLEVLGTKASANLLFSDFKELLATIANNTEKDFLKPLLVNYESAIISELDFDYDRLINDPFINLISSFIGQKRNNEFVSVARAKPSAIVFDVDYVSSDPHALADYRMSLSKSNFVIQKREGTPSEERVYRSKAPLSSEDHETLLQQINDLFKDN